MLIYFNSQIMPLGQAFPDISFAGADSITAFLEERNIKPFSSSKAFDSRTQKLVEVAPYEENGVVYNVTVSAKSTNEMAEQLRSDRNAKLKESDWTQVADAPVDKAAWATYRQALRDLPSNSNWPNVELPVEPS